MRIGSKASRRNSNTGTLPDEDMKLMNAPAATHRVTSGSVTRRNV